MAETIEQTASGRSASREIVLAHRIYSGLPEVTVHLGQIAVIASTELAAGVPRLCWLHAVSSIAGILWVPLSLGIEDPSTRLGLQLVPLQDAADWRVFGWEEEEDISICHGEVEDDESIRVFVAACCMAMEC